MSVAVVVAIIAGISLGVTVVLLLIRGSYQLGKLVNKVDTQEAKIDALEAKFDARFDALTAAINELRDDMQQTNRILVGLANHTHDADGRTMFTIPS